MWNMLYKDIFSSQYFYELCKVLIFNLSCGKIAIFVGLNHRHTNWNSMGSVFPHFVVGDYALRPKWGLKCRNRCFQSCLNFDFVLVRSTKTNILCDVYFGVVCNSIKPCAVWDGPLRRVNSWQDWSSVDSSIASQYSDWKHCWTWAGSNMFEIQV